MSRNRFKPVIVCALLAFSASSIATPLFVDSDDEADSEDGIVVCVDCKEDSLGRVDGSDGSKWKEGADGHWRSDGGEDCYYSKPLDKYICR